MDNRGDRAGWDQTLRPPGRASAMADRRAWRVAILILTMLFSAAPAWAQPEGDPDDDAARNLQRRVPVQFDAARFEQVIAYFAAAAAAPIVVDWDAVGRAGVGPNTPITLELGNRPVALGLRMALLVASGDPEALGYVIQDGKVRITSTASNRAAKLAPATDKDHTANRAAARRLAFVTTVNIHDQPLDAVLEFIETLSGVDMIVDWRQIESAGVKRDAKIKLQRDRVTIAEALSLVFRVIEAEHGVKLDYVIDDGVVIVRAAGHKPTIEPVEAPKPTDPAPGPAAEDLPIATVEDASADVAWGEGAGTQVGDELKLARYTLEQGQAEIVLGRGVSVLLDAPAAIELRDRNAVTLERGVMMAIVPATASGFEVVTPRGTIVAPVAGQIGVKVSDEGAAEVRTFKGRAIVTVKDADEPVQVGPGRSFTIE